MNENDNELNTTRQSEMAKFYICNSVIATQAHHSYKTHHKLSGSKNS